MTVEPVRPGPAPREREAPRTRSAPDSALDGLGVAANLRDVGGHAAGDGGRVRRGLLYRSTALDRLDGATAEAFGRLGVRTVFDLRSRPERAAAPDRLPNGIAYVVTDVIGGADRGSFEHILAILSDPMVARELLADRRGEAMWQEHYRDFVRLETARLAYGRLFATLADAGTRPALMHCSTGKDRTGWAAAALLTFLGVPPDAVMCDFLVSNERLRPFVAPLVARFVEHGGDADLLAPVVGVMPSYLEAALDEMQARHGGVEGYFAEGLRLDPSERARLREAFLVPA